MRHGSKLPSASVAEWLQYLLGKRKDRSSIPDSAIVYIVMLKN